MKIQSLNTCSGTPQRDTAFGQSQEQVHIQEETAWQMRCLGDTAWIDAQVPGTVYTDLLRNGRIDDPFWKDNEDRICALMEKDYEYQCRFTLLPGMLDNQRVVLHLSLIHI